MTRFIVCPLRLLLLALLPLAGHAAPPPYWPGYPPPPYYWTSPPAPAAPQPSPAATPSMPLLPEPTMEEVKPATKNATSEQPEQESIGHETAATVPLNNEQAGSPDIIQEAGENVQAEAPGSQGGKNDTALLQEIAAAIQQGNFAEAYYLWRPRAEAGDAEAQYGIGWMYHNGYGLAISDDEATAWWERASQQGHIDATFALGMLYGLGEGAVQRNMTLAVSYYHRAAREGHEDARLLLRTLMAEGDSNALQLMQTLLSEGRAGEVTAPASVQSTKANIRKGPGTQYKVVTSLQQGHQLLPLKREGRWLLVGIKDKAYTGWIHDSLIEKGILAAL